MSDTSNKLGTFHISSSLQEYESARSNFFCLLVENFEDLLYPEYSYNGRNAKEEYVTRRGGRSAQEVIKLSVSQMYVPHYDLGTIDINRGNSTVKFVDKPTWQGGNIELHDFVGLETKNVLMAWQALAYDVNTDMSGRAGDWYDQDGVFHPGYKRDCTLVEYNPQFEVVRYWKMIGCWISSISESNFEVDGTGARSITCKLEYDRAEMHLPDDFSAKAES